MSDKQEWFDTISDLESRIIHTAFDEFGHYQHREVGLHFIDAGEETTVATVAGEEWYNTMSDSSNTYDSIADIVDYAVFHHHLASTTTVNEHQIQCNNKSIAKKHPNYEALRPFFINASAKVIKRTFEATTQFARKVTNGLQLRRTFRSPFPALNVARRNEPVATDSVFADVPAIDDGSTIAQIYVGQNTLFTDVYPMKTEKQFVNTLEDNIRKRGAMDKLISDRSQVEISHKAKDILRAYCIDDWQSEPHHQHQNYAERRYATIKPLVNMLLNMTGAPPEIWLLALMYVCYILNHIAVESLGWRTPIECLTGSTPDISAIMLFLFWEKVYYKHNDAAFPSDSNEKVGRFVGIAENVGHALTFKILTEDTNKVIYRSEIRSATKPNERNLRVDPIDDSSPTTPVLQSKHDDTIRNGNPMPTIDPSELIGRGYLG